ncbi:triacylglycerol lipase-like protein [Hysterangium stoloniferum]|nr:triacylglycerol lipase-like protein [Hysterangium stoloniferum]
MAIRATAAPSSLHGSSKAPIVDLGYSIYRGTSQRNGQNQFLGIRFAEPPLGNLRFRKPRLPFKMEGIQDANAFGPICIGVGSELANEENEDCLFLNIWAPSNATRSSKLPVFFWIQGGGYNSDANANYNGSQLVQSTGNQMVFVNINYRVGPFGFLSSERLHGNGDLNVGLLDQRFAMEWVQRHITAFGGDPDHVVLVGDSSGAGSIGLHLLAYNATPTRLFSAVFGMSPFFPPQPRTSELEWQFDLFASRAGCATAQDPLQCLRGLNSSALQTANVGMTFPNKTGDTLWPFTPCIDGELLVDFPYRMFEEGRFIKVPAVFGDDTDDGTIFASNATSPADMTSFLMDNYPNLTEADTDAIIALYPEGAPIAQHAAFFPSLAAAYGETAFICPGLEIVSAMAKHAPSWNYRYNVLTPMKIANGLGVSHVSEIPNLFGPGNTPAGSSTADFDLDNISLTPILQAYYTNFVRFFDPNAQPVNGSVFWPEFDSNSNLRLLLQVNATTVEKVPSAQLSRCNFWKNIAINLEQ